MPFWNWWNETSCSRVAEYIRTGTATSPKLITPVQIGRAIPDHLRKHQQALPRASHATRSVADEQPSCTDVSDVRTIDS
ncbi:hypothetical protein Air01nite_02030 [Asanoa iriomotensis]|uniref:Uncharacterized protein n=1 Tax=Asanoa iriomotensis TaxID=234613 RepID=A0ABQ4BUA0_9ACTN|nr:hypothetical protein Air01nite_02030 [Asanoa iriomotensis]